MKVRSKLPVWRSLLFIPVNVERFVKNAHTLQVDAIQLDLEDSVPLAEKEHTRTLLPDAIQKISRGKADIVVRINRPLSLAVRDIEASVSPQVTALSLPKVFGPEHVRLLSEVTSEAEARAGMEIGTTKFIVAVETADAWFQMREIARADPRIVAMTLGGEDFATSVGMTTDPDSLFMPKQAMVIAASAAGILPLGFVGSIADYKDTEAFRLIVRRSRALGFRGASCIHPKQAAVLNEEFGPQPAELVQAHRMIEAYEAAKINRLGAVSFEGRMIDHPIVERAQALIDWQSAIDARLEGS